MKRKEEKKKRRKEEKKKRRKEEKKKGKKEGKKETSFVFGVLVFRATLGQN